MDVKESVLNIVKFILGFAATFGVLFIFPLLVLGIVLLVISTNKVGESKKKFKLWGIISLVFSIGLIVIPIILYALVNVFLAI